MSLVDEFRARFDPAETRARFASRRENASYLDARFDELVAEHPGEWVACCRGQCVLAPTLKEVVARAQEAGFDRREYEVGLLAYNDAVALL